MVGRIAVREYAVVRSMYLKFQVGVVTSAKHDVCIVVARIGCRSNTLKLPRGDMFHGASPMVGMVVNVFVCAVDGFLARPYEL